MGRVGGHAHAFADPAHEGAELAGVGRIAGNPFAAVAVGRLHAEAMKEVGRHRVEDVQLPPLAAHAGPQLEQAGRQQRAAHVARDAAREAQLRLGEAVDAGADQLRTRAHDLRLGSRQKAHHAHRVAARVHEGAARQRELVADVVE